MAEGRQDAADWAVLIDQWRQSGLSLPAFCERRGISRGTMQNWVYKPTLKRAVEDARREAQSRAADAGRSGGDSAPTTPTAIPFLPVRVTEAATAHEASDDAGVAIVLGAGRRVVVTPGFDPETLRRVVAVLEGRSC